jgi:hypothetical protein
MVQQEGKMVLPSRRRQAVQASSYNKMQASSLGTVLSSRRRLMQDNSTVAVPAQASSLGKMVLPSRRRLMQDNSTVAVSVDGTTRNRHSDGPVWFSTVH